MSIMHQITILLPGKEPQSYILEDFHRDVVLFGRGQWHGDSPACPPNDVIIPNEQKFSFISRAHATLLWENGRWYISDDKSMNGIRFQGRKFQRKEILDGDKIYIGQDETKQLVVQCDYVAQSDDVTVEAVPLTGQKRISIGRDRNCDIVIRHPTASRQHCFITLENGEYYITDNHSANGVLLNGSPLLKKEKLHQMDKIMVAHTTMFFSDGYLYFSEPRGGVGVYAEHLCKQVGRGQRQKYITNDVTLGIQPNEFVAIIGGSGAGKTTLLDCLSGMTDFTGGEVFISGESIRTAGRNLRSLIGYVPQKDIVYDALTLERMLSYSLQLRMPQDTSPEEREAKIREVLETVELYEHKDTLIRSLSGGQRKRASIAIELLASPKLFFLDEPSSGLDPGTEKHLMQMLKRLSQSGKTVIMVTHTVQNIDLCDRLICMGKGGVLCYSGSPSDALSFFGKKHLTDIYDDLNEHAPEISERFRRLVSADASREGSSTRPAKVSRKSFSQFRQFHVMALRYTEILARSPARLALLLALPVILTLLVCAAYEADGNLYNVLKLNIVREIFPFLTVGDTKALISAFSCAAFWTGIFNSIQEISKERYIYEREKFTGVAALPYVMSKFVPLFILCVIQSGLMTAVLTLMSRTTASANTKAPSITDIPFGIGLNVADSGVVFPGNLLWLELFVTVFLCVLSAMCIGLAISSVVSNDMALVVCPICLLPQILFSGVAATLTGFTKMISGIITCRWSCLALLTSVGVNRMFSSVTHKNKWVLEKATSEVLGSTIDLIDYDYDVATHYLFGLNPVLSAWVAMSLMCAIAIVLAVLVLHFRRSHTR